MNRKPWEDCTNFMWNFSERYTEARCKLFKSWKTLDVDCWISFWLFSANVSKQLHNQKWSVKLLKITSRGKATGKKKYFFLLKYGKREVWVRSKSIVPKRNNGLMTLCYVWAKSASVLPTRNNGSIIHCYVGVRLIPTVPILNNAEYK